MISKQAIVAVIILATCNNNFYAMKKEDNSDSEKFCHLTCHRPSGDWQMRYRFAETSKESQREPWHQHTSYVAVPLCTVSNIPFFVVAHAIKNTHPAAALALTFAGSASAA